MSRDVGMLTRRGLLQGFALGAAGLLVPEPVKAYSFVGGWRPAVGKATTIDPADFTHSGMHPNSPTRPGPVWPPLLGKVHPPCATLPATPPNGVKTGDFIFSTHEQRIYVFTGERWARLTT